MHLHPPTSTLFPYTTLFRSSASLYSGFPSDDAYFHAIYDQGTQFLADVRAAMGADRFWAAWRDYYSHYTGGPEAVRSEEHTSELQSQFHLVCRLLPEKKKHR